MLIEKWAFHTVTGSCKKTCSKHMYFLLIYTVFQSLHYSSEVECFAFPSGMAPDDGLLANARYDCKVIMPKSYQ